MLTLDELQQSFYNGHNCYKNGDFRSARYWFQLALEHPSYRNNALLKIVQIDIKEGKFASSRKLLEENEEIDNVFYHQVYALLETIECNFDSSKEHYKKCMTDTSMQYKTLFALSKMYIQFGDYEIAKNMLETLRLNDNFYLQATLELASLKLLEGKYLEARTVLKTIPEDKLYLPFSLEYQVLDVYSLSCLGEINSLPSQFDPNRDYTFRRMFDKDDEGLYRHLEKHLNQEDKDTNGCFFKYTDTKRLVGDVKSKIKNLNANHFGTADHYKLRLDTPIGYKGDIITNDLCVVTLFGTETILTMYPVDLSKDFDKEGFTHNKEIMLKRTKGVQR